MLTSDTGPAPDAVPAPPGPPPSPPSGSSTATVVTIVHTDACHLCDDAVSAVAELAAGYRVRVELTDARSPQGIALAREHRVAVFPLVLVDGVYFSSGRLPRGKLRRLLDEQAVTAVAG